MVGILIFLAYWIMFFRNKQKIALFLLFLQATGCFQLIPVDWITLNPIVSKPYDWISLVLIFHILLYGFRFRPYKIKFSFAFKIFFIYLLALLFYSIFILNVEVKVSFSVFRNYLLLLCPIIFLSYDSYILRDSLKTICIITVLAAGLYVLQAIVGQPLLASYQSDAVASGLGSGGVARFYNMPFYTLFAFIYFSNEVFKKINVLNVIFMSILFGAILVSFNRNTLVVTILSTIGIYFYNKKVNILTIGAITIFGSIAIYAATALQSDRLNAGSSDLQVITHLSKYRDPSNFDPRKVSTTEFRLLHFYERYIYVRSSGTYLTGIGLVNEQSNVTNHLNFRIGLPKAMGSKDITQVDTADIVWSLLILQLGLLGIILFCWLMMSYVFFFFKNRNFDTAYQAAIFLLCLGITSLFGVDIMMTADILLYSMLYVLVYKLSNSTIIIQYHSVNRP